MTQFQSLTVKVDLLHFNDGCFLVLSACLHNLTKKIKLCVFRLEMD